MSAVPVIEKVVAPTPARKRRTPTDHPATIIELPIVRSAPKARPKRNAKAKRRARLASAVTHAVTFFAVATLSSAVLSLAGQVLLEQARKNSMTASERTRAAIRESASLRDDVMLLTGASSVERWASANGFVQAQGAPLPSGSSRTGGLVALNR